MLRTDGTYTIYFIQHQYGDNPKWANSIENEELFTACDDCWQETGVMGTYDLEEAKRAFGEVVSRLDQKRTFRLAQMDISQKIKPLSR